jgi:anion-transporting  ArsA/GET3 family ATPase
MSLDLTAASPPLIVCVGSGGVGKTTLAAAMGLVSAQAGHDTLVMTFDPSLRLKDALGVGDVAQDQEVPVAVEGPGLLYASLLDARRTFDRLVERYSPDEAARERILRNPYYDHLAGHLGGILEYMAVERLYEVARAGRYQRIILDTPPARQAIDFLEAPKRITSFLDSGALKIALRRWFDEDGRLMPARGLGFLGRGVERFLDKIVGLDLLRDMSEFFQAFEPLFAGFHQRAAEVEKLLADASTQFLLVAAPGESRNPDTLFFARKLQEAGWNLGPIVVNRTHPTFERHDDSGSAAAGVSVDGEGDGSSGDPSDLETRGRELFAWLGERDARGLAALRSLLPRDQVVAEMPLEPDEPTDLVSLAAMGARLQRRLDRS